MVILGLGSNLGDRLARLRQALHHLKEAPGLLVKQVSPVYMSDALLPPNAPPHWGRPYFNAALRCETTLSPEALLTCIKTIEKKMGRTPDKDWGPRLIDIDILAWDDRVHYDEKLHVPHEHLTTRPFALWPLADVAPHWVYPAKGPFKGKTAIEIAEQWGPNRTGLGPLRTKTLPYRIDFPQLVGIVNITPDSFSDGGHCLNLEAALRHIEHLKKHGAEIIDLGAEATGPSAQAIGPDAEWERLAPIVSLALEKRHEGPLPIKISVDTRHAKTAEKALTQGVDWINDVSGLEDGDMRHVLRSAPCDIVVMHHLGIPVQSNTLPLHENPTKQVYQWIEEKLVFLEKQSISRERLIIDPGIGYGKTAEQSLALLQSITIFKKLGVRLLVGHSRKSFLKQFTLLPPEERDIETITLSLSLAKQAVDYLRVHNVECHERSFKVASTIDL